MTEITANPTIQPVKKASVHSVHPDPAARARALARQVDEAAQRLASSTATAAAQTQYRMMRRVAEDLEAMSLPLQRAMEHCRAMLEDPSIREDAHVLRDTKHLSARIDAMSAQMEDTLQTLERLAGQPRRGAPAEEPALRRARPVGLRSADFGLRIGA